MPAASASVCEASHTGEASFSTGQAVDEALARSSARLPRPPSSVGTSSAGAGCRGFRIAILAHAVGGSPASTASYAKAAG
jgi:hypothetical protein